MSRKVECVENMYDTYNSVYIESKNERDKHELGSYYWKKYNSKMERAQTICKKLEDEIMGNDNWRQE